MDARRVRELLVVGRAGRAVGELQQQPVPPLDDRPPLGDTHVTDRHHLLRGALIGYVLHLADGRVAVAARHSVDGPAYVDVVLLQVRGVRQIHGVPVAAGGGA